MSTSLQTILKTASRLPKLKGKFPLDNEFEVPKLQQNPSSPTKVGSQIYSTRHFDGNSGRSEIISSVFTAATAQPVRSVGVSLWLARSLSHPQDENEMGNEERKGKKSKRKRRKWNFFEGISNTRMAWHVGLVAATWRHLSSLSLRLHRAIG